MSSIILRNRMLLTACAITLSFLDVELHVVNGLAINTSNRNTLPVDKTTYQHYSQHMKTKIASSEAKCERRRQERERSISREKCSQCNRPPILCVCGALPKQKVNTSTNVLVLQHPNEFKRKSLSTVPLMPLVLENCTVKVGYNFEPDSLELVKNCVEDGKKPLLLFPGPDAISLDDNEDGDDDSDYDGDDDVLQHDGNRRDKVIHNLKNENEQLLILVDGTWAEAKRMLTQSPTLVKLCQQVQFSLSYDSIYDAVRKEPENHCISTLEACGESLLLLEPDEDVGKEAKEKLENVMKHMVDIKRKIYEMQEPEPRFMKPGMRSAKISEQSKKIEVAMFGQD